MHPDNAPTAMESLAHMVDEVWYHAGDTSTDVSGLLTIDQIDLSVVKVVVIVSLFVSQSTLYCSKSPNRPKSSLIGK